MKKVVALIGPSDPSREVYQDAYIVGKLIAREGWTLVNGGGPGVMEASAKGVREEGGISIGIIPYGEFRGFNAFIDVVIPTGIQEMRNFLIIKAAHAVIVCGYSEGTLIEISIANKLKKYMVGLHVPDIPGVVMGKASDPEEAVLKVKKFLEVLA